ncbi:unnamed protein product, partial [Ostreobium quekettii]
SCGDDIESLKLHNLTLRVDGLRMDKPSVAITAAVKKAKDGLPEARYHCNMLRFLCHQMEMVECLVPWLPRDAPQEIVVMLEVEMERGSSLIRRHGRQFDLRGFSKVDIVLLQVEQMCVVFRECLLDLGLEKGTFNIQTEMDANAVDEDKRYKYWYLNCILEGREIDREMPEVLREELEEQVLKQRHRMEVVIMIPEEEIKIEESIAAGGQGMVYKGMWRDIAVAVKMLGKDLTPESRAELLSEVELHIQLSHPNVARCFGATASRHDIVMELASTDLERFYWSRGSEFDWPMKLRLMLSAGSGVQHLHKSRMVHGDIKTANFLVFPPPAGGDVVIKISDFGLTATETETKSKTAFPMCGTFGWLAPELYDGAPRSFSSDVFSFGLVLFELASLALPYRGLTNPMVVNRKRDGRAPVLIPHTCPEALVVLMMRCISPASFHRPTMDEVCTELEDVLLQVEKVTLYLQK